MSSPSTRIKVNHLCIRYLCIKSARGDFLEGHSYASRCFCATARTAITQWCTPASCISARNTPAIRISAPASNKPHLTEKSTPVWLAIWRIWARFANSQHRNAAFATPDNICAHSSLLPHWAAAQTDANLSAHLHRLPTPPPYLRRMRLSRGQDAGVRWVIRLSPGRVRRSCKSPRARILVLGTSGAHWPARWPQFELTERVVKS